MLGAEEGLARRDSIDAAPQQMASRIDRQVRQLTIISDPYRRAKDEATQQAPALYHRQKKVVSHSSGPLETALRIAIAGNIIDNGSDAPVTLLDQCSQPFRDRFSRAKVIIAKGRANYESLSDNPATIFFLLQAKCSVIARNLCVDEGSIVLKQHKTPGT